MMSHVVYTYSTRRSRQRLILHVPPFEHGDALVAHKKPEEKKKKKEERKEKKKDPLAKLQECKEGLGMGVV